MAPLLSAPMSRASQQHRTAADAVRHSLLWYQHPAGEWTEALPIGNGSLGAMVFGGIKRERLQLNEDTLWSGGPYSNVNPKARAALPKVRELIFAGKYAEAEAYADAHVQAVPMREMAYQALGDCFIDLPQVNETSAADYRRELDLDTAIARTRFTTGGRAYVREVFASPVHHLIAVSIRAEGGTVSADFSLASGQRVEVSASDATLTMHGVNNEDRGIAGKLRFTAMGKVRASGGMVSADGPILRVRDARSVLFLLTAATSHRSPSDVSGDPNAITIGRLAAVDGLSYAALRDAHVAEHQRLFRRVSLDLGRGERADQPTDQRLEHAADSDDPSLAALYFQFARYLMISSSRPGTQPANLQGIWNDSNQPPWQSKYTININTEMNYWPVDSADLSECIEPLTAMVEQLAVSGARTAKEMYGARGWVAHHNTDLWRASGPIDHARTGLWPTGGAWLATQLWDHWDYVRDDAYLKRIYPLLAGAARFFLDTLVRDPRTGHMVTNPSFSPENDHGHGSTLCAGPTMDMQILRDLFDRTGAAAKRLGRDGDLRRDVAAMRDRLAPDRIGAKGQLQEWQFDWDMDATDPHHRHVSHLYGLYPSHQINPDDTPALTRAARTSLEMRGDDATGWGLGWRLNLWARLRDGAHAHRILIHLLSPGRTYTNMFDAHPPFQIDGNFGGAAGILEMLVQSRDDRIDLLPALPPGWPAGSLRGIRVRGACRLDLTWRDGRVTEATLHPERDGRRVIHTPHGSLSRALRRGRTVTLRSSDFA
ncbi:glycoside hydrolase family 95 protein [Stakelama saccharophila]|uniref:Glycoside hydrolase family 95 protein n=1 Tax=Stakelama saccharophila TaxID=3075605 RepID=A0ABZ0B4S1_9SPHN|nr:glycoside hydrolase family 95 protein [Stakelama sp. W311]WNO52378.1 glycoside hydrolase family 95 protein [Stakelama sp. W311]